MTLQHCTPSDAVPVIGNPTQIHAVLHPTASYLQLVLHSVQQALPLSSLVFAWVAHADQTLHFDCCLKAKGHIHVRHICWNTRETALERLTTAVLLNIGLV